MYGIDDIKKAKGLHIAHMNVRSIANKWELFKIHFSCSNLHILGISETWLNNKLPNEMFSLSKDYYLYRNDRNWIEPGSSTVKKGGGVAIYIKNNLISSDTEFQHLNKSCKDIEVQWISIRQPNIKTIVVGNIYRPPQGNVDSFIQVLEDTLDCYDLNRTEIYLMGDLNIDIMDKKNPSTKKLVDLTKPYGLRQLIKHPTRYSKDKNTILDLIYTNSDFIYDSGVCDVNLSDHQLILTTRNKIKTRYSKCNFTGRSYRNYNKEEFQNKVHDSDWRDYDQINTVSGKWKEMLRIILKCIDELCPTKSFSVKQEKEPWITPQLIELIKDKDHAIKKAKRKNKDPNLWKQAKQLRNTCTKRVRNARAEYIQENLENNLGNSKKFWKNIQNVLPNKKNGSKVTFDLYDKETKSPVQATNTANYINDFSTGIGPKLAQQFNTGWEYFGVNTDKILSDIRTNYDEVLKLCKEININKSSSIPNLSSEILRDAPIAIPWKVVELFNLSFELSEVPDEWKIAKVTPIPKAGKSNDVSNLRPVSLLPPPSKLIEKIVHDRIYTFCNDNNLINKKQGDFRPKHSTISTTAFYIDDLYNAMNNNQTTISVYIDAMKAFDTVDHGILLKKIKYYGISGKCAKWVENYLKNRKQYTVANDTISDPADITYGVPQGSVCGPLLFLLYINDISHCLDKCKVSLYADDTVLYYSSDNINEALRSVQKDLTSLNNWCHKNKITVNCKKTKYCVYGMRSIIKKSKNVDMLLSLNNTVLEKVCSYKYLGFILDDQLNFNKHISETVNVVSHKLYLLSKIRKYLTKQASIMIFKTMILSLIEYGNTIYAGTSIRNLDKLDKLYYRGLRICDGTNNAVSRLQLRTDCHLDKLSVRRDRHLLLFMHKQTKNIDLIKKTNVRTRLHQAPVFKTYKPNNEKARQNILYRGACLWNEKPSDIRNLDFTAFKSKIV